MRLTDRQGFCLMTAFLLGNVLASIGGISQTSKTGYLSVGVSYLIFLLFTFIYRQIFTKNNQLGFFEMIKQLFCKRLQFLLLLGTAFFSFLATLLSSLNFLEFIEASTYYQTPRFPLVIFILLLIVYLALSEEKAMGRYSEIVLPIIFFAIIILIFFGRNDWDFNHLRNIREFRLPEFFRVGFTTFLSPFSEMIFVYILFDSLHQKTHMTRISIASGSTVVVIFILLYLFNLLVLGKELLSAVQFPTFYAASVVKVGTIIEKAETLITFAYSFCDLLYSAVCLLVGIKATTALTKLFCSNVNPPKIKKITAWTAAIFLLIILSMPWNPIQMQSVFSIAALIFIPFTVGIPLLLLIKTFFFQRKNH